MEPPKRYSSPLEDEPSAKRRQTTLETVTNDLDDTIHDHLDTLVLKACGSDPIETRRDFVLLLEKIISKSQGKLDQKYEGKVARALIEDHPELKRKLKEAWNNKSFKDIRNLRAIRAFYLSTRDRL